MLRQWWGDNRTDSHHAWAGGMFTLTMTSFWTRSKCDVFKVPETLIWRPACHLQPRKLLTCTGHLRQTRNKCWLWRYSLVWKQLLVAETAVSEGLNVSFPPSSCFSIQIGKNQGVINQTSRALQGGLRWKAESWGILYFGIKPIPDCCPLTLWSSFLKEKAIQNLNGNKEGQSWVERTSKVL